MSWDTVLFLAPLRATKPPRLLVFCYQKFLYVKKMSSFSGWPLCCGAVVPRAPPRWRGTRTWPTTRKRSVLVQTKTLDRTTQYRKTNHWPILLKLWRSSFQFFKDSSNRKPETACNPYIIGHVANELRHQKFREYRMGPESVFRGGVTGIQTKQS